MAEQHRKARFIGRLNTLLQACIKAKRFREATDLAKIIGQLNGWIKVDAKALKVTTDPSAPESESSGVDWADIVPELAEQE